MESVRAFYKGDIYHICNRSISNYHIFRHPTFASHFLTTLTYYNTTIKKLCLSKALLQPLILPYIVNRDVTNIFIPLAFCIMPDHYHLLIKVHYESQISKYINDVQNSYTRYYNKIHNRKGPLWQNRFRAIKIEDDAAILHVLRYIHLNPTTAGLAELPQEWKWSSYQEYMTNPALLKMNTEISIRSVDNLRQFTEDQIDYQKTIKGIRRKLLE